MSTRVTLYWMNRSPSPVPLQGQVNSLARRSCTPLPDSVKGAASQAWVGQLTETSGWSL